MATDKHTEKLVPDDAQDQTDDRRDASMAQSNLGAQFVAAEGEEAPSEEDLLTLRRVSDNIPFKAYTIAFVELVERLSYYGATQVYVNFIQFPRPGTATGRALDPKASDAQPGFLGMGQRASTGLTTFNQFWVYFLPLFGAYIADTYTGRFRLIWMSVIVSVIGHAILTASAAPSVIDRGQSSALAAYITGMIIMGVGTGGFKPNISPLIAEQIPHDRIFVMTTKKGERVLVDPAVTLSRVYNWFYLFINVGALIGQITMVYAERYDGFYLSYLLPTLAFCIALPVLFFCRKWYRHTKPEGSVLGPAFRLLVLGSKGRWHANPVRTYRHMTDGTFWTNVMPSHLKERKPKWMQFDDHWVSEVGRGFAACKVFTFYPLWWLSYNQINNNLTSQAASMQLHGLPNDIVANLDPLALIILIPLFDIFVYPLFRKLGWNFSPIKRISMGFLTGTMAMIWAAVVQYYIYKKSPCGHYASGTLPGTDTACPKPNINVWAQTGSYILIAISEIFASITSLEYAFSKAPKNMRSMVQAIALFTSALSAALGQAFVSLSADPLLIWNYASVAIICAVSGIAFTFLFRDLDKQEDALNALPEGHMRHGQGDDELESLGSTHGSGKTPVEADALATAKANC